MPVFSKPMLYILVATAESANSRVYLNRISFGRIENAFWIWINCEAVLFKYGIMLWLIKKWF